MATYYPELAQRVRAQSSALPALYRGIDFDSQPYRTTTRAEDPSTLPAWVAERAPLLADEQVVELVSTATWLGDVVADAYAALMGQYSVTNLISMVKTACREGIDAVEDAPPELVALIADMEATPDWIDMGLVRKGAHQARIQAALLTPFVIRGTFIATFVNTYSALPMALTGALTSGKRAARRVNETTSFFALTTAPGALERHGPGFEAAAMVRLMHSMVRYNALKRSDRWDVGIYGMPIPQIDQMPAGMISVYLLALRARRAGRTEFNTAERAVVEFSRYRCFLLGLPEELVPASLPQIVDLMNTRAAMLRDDFDDATCGEMVRATMAAYLRPTDRRLDRMADAVERSYSRAAFTRAYCSGDRAVAETMGVTIGVADYLRIALTAPFVVGRWLTVRRASRSPWLRPIADAYVIRMLNRRLVNYGQPEFTSDASQYTPAG
ncbi:oxygenase MpaB family protein [[Mycobacterium] nativiensis]|uniref:Oxygenase MpaB family protein n=1 Tax=[Mycobacterium] nativiensis TaxID=2855503 RepID=A0ABU5XXB0_9MYCO|nr:oxygenase MpaB family protein [Mycolicibacter sp. MYC340]MEB3032412.1 oxygenase MpaB family protein [Mycolicibacter sp. MYC340]